MMDLLRKLVDAGVLSSVDKLMDPELPLAAEAYVLRFEQLTITIGVNPDDDTVVIVEGERVGPSQTKTPVEPIWANAVGRPLRWAWLLTNQQGYRDGVQLEWAHPEEARGVCLQLVAVVNFASRGDGSRTLPPAQNFVRRLKLTLRCWDRMPFSSGCSRRHPFRDPFRCPAPRPAGLN